MWLPGFAPRDRSTSRNSPASSVLNRNSILPFQPGRKSDDSNEINKRFSPGRSTESRLNRASPTGRLIWRLPKAWHRMRIFVITRHPQNHLERRMCRFPGAATSLVLNHPVSPSSATTMPSCFSTGASFSGMEPRLKRRYKSDFPTVSAPSKNSSPHLYHKGIGSP